MVTMTAAGSADATVPVGRNPAFRQLLRASSVSMLGSHVTSIAYPLLVLRLTNSPFEAGWVAFAAIAPSLLVHVPAGALVDRWDPRRAMLVSEIGRGAAIAAVAITLAMGKPRVPLLTVAAVIEGVLEVFSTLAERRCVGSLVRGDQVPPALVRLEARTHVVLLAGRPLGALLFGIAPILPFLADVASFIYSVTALVRLKSRWPTDGKAEARREPASGGGLRMDIRNGLHQLRGDRFACVVIIMFSAGTLIFQALIMAFLADAHAQKLSALFIGIVLAASGVGGAAGSAAASRLLKRVSHTWIRLQAFIWFLGFAVLALLACRQILLMATVMAILGFTGAMGNIELDIHLMRNFDEDMLARVTSMSRLVALIACATGPVLGGILVQGLGVQGALTCLFLITSGLPLLAIFVPSRPAADAIPGKDGRRSHEIQPRPGGPSAGPGAAPETAGSPHDRRDVRHRPENILSRSAPAYTNVIYPFSGDPLRMPSNSAGGHERHVTLPLGWKLAESAIFRLDWADSRFAALVNGAATGRGTGGRLVGEFGISHILRPADDVIAVRVGQWPTGSYLEDQDMWWLPGILRSATLASQPIGMVGGYFVRAGYADDHGVSILEVDTGSPAILSVHPRQHWHEWHPGSLPRSPRRGSRSWRARGTTIRSAKIQ